MNLILLKAGILSRLEEENYKLIIEQNKDNRTTYVYDKDLGAFLSNYPDYPATYEVRNIDHDIMYYLKRYEHISMDRKEKSIRIKWNDEDIAKLD